MENVRKIHGHVRLPHAKWHLGITNTAAHLDVAKPTSLAHLLGHIA